MPSRTRLAQILFALALFSPTGCAELPDKGDVFDPDGDGWDWPEDCQSDNPSVYPGATDSTQDRLDQNCDGVDGTDADADGHASLATGGGDCDDADGAIHPGVDEAPYDGLDNDCDAGTRDDDIDGDGYVLAEDCDDNDATAFPGAQEVCGDGVVNDCGGSVATSQSTCAGTQSAAGADAKLYGELAQDFAAYAVAGVGDLNGDNLGDLFIGAYGQDAGGANAGAAYLVLGGFTGSPGLSEARARLLGESPEDYLGISVSGAGDLDGDGVPDLVVGADGEDSGGGSAGAAYLISGQVSGTPGVANSLAKLFGEASLDYAGASVAGVGDTNEGLVPDVLVGAYGHDGGGVNSGAAYLVLGGVPGPQPLGDARAKLLGEAANDYAGVAVAAVGDVDGDGRSDLFVGAPGHDDAFTDAGAAYVVSGTVSGVVSLAEAPRVFVGEGELDHAGSALAGPGDVDADGYADLLVGAPEHNGGSEDTGAAYLLLSTGSGAAEEARLIGAAGGDSAGRSVAGAGDLDGDNAPDLLIGADGQAASGPNAGAAYLVPGDVSGTVILSDAMAALIGEGASDRLGISVAGPGDVDGDGVPDLLVGSYFGQNELGLRSGAAYLVSGTFY